MKDIVRYGLAALMLSVLIASCSRDKAHRSLISAGNPAPNLSLADLNGKKVSLADLKGNAVVMSFFATWCPPCKNEMPLLETRIWQPMKQKGVVVLGVNTGEEKEEVQQFVREQKLSFPILLPAEGELPKDYQAEGIPRLLILDRKHTIRLDKLGFDPSEFDNVVKTVEDLASSK